MDEAGRYEALAALGLDVAVPAGYRPRRARRHPEGSYVDPDTRELYLIGPETARRYRLDLKSVHHQRYREDHGLTIEEHARLIASTPIPVELGERGLETRYTAGGAVLR